MISPRRGEVWLVDLGMAAKVRPALVISIPAEDTDRALVTLVPHTTSPRQSSELSVAPSSGEVVLQHVSGFVQQFICTRTMRTGSLINE